MGKTYKIVHSRKGEFIIRVTELGSGSCTGKIIDSKATMISYEDRMVGEIVQFKLCLCDSIEEVKQ